MELISYVKKVVALGTPIDDLNSFTALLNPDLVERVLNHQWERDGSVPKTYTIDLAKKLFVIARSEKCLDQSGIARLDDMRANLEQYRREGMTPKNLQLIRHVVSGEVWRRVVNCPKELMIKARSWKNRSPLKAAITAQIAVAVAIETAAPVRASNLAAIRLGENLIKPGGPDTPYWLVFPDYDVKNRVDLEFPLNASVTAIIDEYVHEFRPTLLLGSNDDSLFPGASGGHKMRIILAIRSPRALRR